MNLGRRSGVLRAARGSHITLQFVLRRRMLYTSYGGEWSFCLGHEWNMTTYLLNLQLAARRFSRHGCRLAGWRVREFGSSPQRSGQDVGIEGSVVLSATEPSAVKIRSLLIAARCARSKASSRNDDPGMLTWTSSGLQLAIVTLRNANRRCFQTRESMGRNVRHTHDFSFSRGGVVCIPMHGEVHHANPRCAQCTSAPCSEFSSNLRCTRSAGGDWSWRK